jgi:mRNA interferase MazF
MRRGDIVTIVTPGDYGKPRPAIIVQSDRLHQTRSVLVCPLTTTNNEAFDVRVLIQPDPDNGLRAVSFAMPDKATPVQRQKCGPVIGRVPDPLMSRLDEMLALAFGLVM